MTDFRQRTVVVGVIYEPNSGFLLFDNERWGGYAFPMKKMDDEIDPAEVALAALDDDSPLYFPDASADPLAITGAYGLSGSAGVETYYCYHVHQLDPKPMSTGLMQNQRAKFFPFPVLLAAHDVTWSTKAVARAIVYEQEVAVAVIRRAWGGDNQFLLVYKPNYGYFFPAQRVKTDARPDAVAVSAIRVDTGYADLIHASWCCEVPDVHLSQRWGALYRQYRFHICLADLEGVDWADPDNPFQTTLDHLANAWRKAGHPAGSRGYAAWFSEQELRSDPERSPTIDTLLPSVLSCLDRRES